MDRKFVLVMYEDDGSAASVSELTKLVGWVDFTLEADRSLTVDELFERYGHPAALQSMVLLKNDNAVLPLSRGARIAVIGPLATATYDLNGTWSGLGTGAGTTPPVTVLDGIKAGAADPAAVSFAQGCDIESEDTSGFAAAAEAA